MPLVFGNTYDMASLYTKQMFLTLLVFPTAILQANMLVAIKLEKFDMIFNVISLGLYLLFAFAGLYFYKSLLIINVSIFSSFIIFHILQDVLLIRRKLADLPHVLTFYIRSIFCMAAYFLLVQISSLIFAFCILWIVIAIGFAGFTFMKKPVLYSEKQ
jgi:hypothetical protein